MAELPVGTRIGKYETERVLGQGAFGVVFAARDVDLDREVAMKLLMPQHTLDTHLMQRFFHEAKAAAKIAHPSIVTIYDFGKVAGSGTLFDGSAYIAMEMVRGESLARRIQRRGPQPAATVLELGRQIASALGAAHASEIIHRDLKPDNLMLARDPVAPLGERVKVLDFGIAKLAEAAKSQSLKTVGAFGTPVYMAPEQFKAAGEVDARADIYALGCILFELATGKPPFDGEDIVTLFQQHSSAIRVPLQQLPPDVSDLVLQMLSPDAGDRPPSMAAVEAALTPGGGPSAVAVATTQMPGGAHERAPVATTLGAAAGVTNEGDPAPRRRTSWWWGTGAGAAVLAFAVAAAWHAGGHSEVPSRAAAARPDEAAIGGPPPDHSTLPTDAHVADAIPDALASAAARAVTPDAATPHPAVPRPASRPPPPVPVVGPVAKSAASADSLGGPAISAPKPSAETLPPDRPTSAAPHEPHKRCATDDAECNLLRGP